MVPNAPCGVESSAAVNPAIFRNTVPNAPCGVESSVVSADILPAKTLFLMHRVELKALLQVEKKVAHQVPNAPCGVESLLWKSG